MKPTLINRTLMAPEDAPTKRELDQEEFEQKALAYVAANFSIEEVFDTYNHDKEVSLPFAEYLSYHYVTVRTEEGYRHKAGGVWFTTDQIWDEYCSLLENKQP